MTKMVKIGNFLRPRGLKIANWGLPKSLYRRRTTIGQVLFWKNDPRIDVFAGFFNFLGWSPKVGTLRPRVEKMEKPAKTSILRSFYKNNTWSPGFGQIQLEIRENHQNPCSEHGFSCIFWFQKPPKVAFFSIFQYMQKKHEKPC